MSTKASLLGLDSSPFDHMKRLDAFGDFLRAAGTLFRLALYDVFPL